MVAVVIVIASLQLQILCHYSLRFTVSKAKKPLPKADKMFKKKYGKLSMLFCKLLEGVGGIRSYAFLQYFEKSSQETGRAFSQSHAFLNL
jgi:hypothetical protein